MEELIEKIQSYLENGNPGETTPIEDATNILDIIKEAGYVQLAADQTPPENSYPVSYLNDHDNMLKGYGYDEGQQHMLTPDKGGYAFRRVKILDKCRKDCRDCTIAGCPQRV